MPIKSIAGNVQDPIFYRMADFRKKSSERIGVYGPFKISGKKVVVANIEKGWEALQGETGTLIVRD